MRRFLSILMVIAIFSCSVVSINAASVDVAQTGYRYNTPYVSHVSVGRTSSGCPSRIDVTFHSVSGVSWYRVYCKMVYAANNRTILDWYGMGDFHDGGSWNPTVSAYLGDKWLSYMDTLGYYDVNCGDGVLGSSCVDVAPVKIYIAVRGVSASGNWLTDCLYPTWWINFYEDDFCPVIKGMNRFGNQVELNIRTNFPLSASAIRYYRLYYRRDGEWYPIGNYSISSSYVDNRNGRTATIRVPSSYFNRCDVYGDGTSALAVRGLNRSEKWCTPFIKQFVWNRYL